MSDPNSRVPLTMMLSPPTGADGIRRTPPRNNEYVTEYDTGTHRVPIRGILDQSGAVFTVTAINGQRPRTNIVVPVYTLAGGCYELVTNELAQAAIGPLAPNIPVPEWRTNAVKPVRAIAVGLAGDSAKPAANIANLSDFLNLTEAKEDERRDRRAPRPTVFQGLSPYAFASFVLTRKRRLRTAPYSRPDRPGGIMPVGPKAGGGEA